MEHLFLTRKCFVVGSATRNTVDDIAISPLFANTVAKPFRDGVVNWFGELANEITSIFSALSSALVSLERSIPDLEEESQCLLPKERRGKMFRIIKLTAALGVKVKVRKPFFFSIPTNEMVCLAENEIGFIVGDPELQRQGVLCQAGIIHPGWKGELAPTFITLPSPEPDDITSIPILVGQEIAHAVIFSFDQISGRASETARQKVE